MPATVVDALLANSPYGLGLWDGELRCVLVNKAFAALTGLTVEQHHGQRLADLLPQLTEPTLAALRAALAANEPLPDVEIAGGPGPDGLRPHWQVRFFAVRSPQDVVLGLGADVREITDRKRLEASLAHRATHDPLTGLPDRRLFAERVAEALSRTERSGRPTAVLYVDLDGFKRVNDELGHAAGDALLVEVAARLRGVLRPSDTVGRLGGDEFAVLCEDLDDQRDGIAVAERILDSLVAPARIAGRDVVAQGSVGIAIAGESAIDPERLMNDADAAMYRAKHSGGGRWEIFDQAMARRLKRRVEFEQALRRSVGRDELRLLFQPQYSLVGGEAVGVEALVRWQHPQRGLLTPDAFIRQAEATGVIHDLGAWVLEEACRSAAELLDGDGRPLRIAINISAAQLSRVDLVDAVAGALQRHQVQPQRLGLEITETLFMQDTRANAITVAALRSLGVRIVLDDFGAGYSSLGYLRRLPLDEIKLDQTFVSRLPVNRERAGAVVDERIASFVIGLAQALKIGAVAEGVETGEQMRALGELGYDVIQGYLVGRPLGLEELRRHLLASKPSSSPA